MARALSLIAVLFLIYPAALGAQDFRVVTVDSGQWPLLKLTAVLPTGGGDPRAYRLKLGPEGRPLAAGSLTGFDSSEPASLLVALDTSYTLTPAHLKAVQNSLSRYAAEFGSGERLALLGFNNTIHLTTGFTASQDTFTGDINRLRLGGRKTELYRSLLHGIELLGKNEGGRHLLVVSDGHDEGSGQTAEQVLRSATEKGVKISVIGLAGLSSDAADRHLAVLKNLAEETGGVYFPAAGAEESGSGLYDILIQQRASVPGEPEALFQLVFDLGQTPAPVEILPAELNYTSANGLWVAEFSLSVPTKARPMAEVAEAQAVDGQPDDSYLAFAGDEPKNID